MDNYDDGYNGPTPLLPRPPLEGSYSSIDEQDYHEMTDFINDLQNAIGRLQNITDNGTHGYYSSRLAKLPRMLWRELRKVKDEHSRLHSHIIAARPVDPDPDGIPF